MAASDGASLNTPLWRFSIAVYGIEGVAPECLDVQDRFNVDVNLLLFAAYAGAIEGVAMSGKDIEDAEAIASPWHKGIVRNLREARRVLKSSEADNANPLRPQAAELRQKVKIAELEAERIEQAMLWAWWQSRSPSHHGDAEPTLESNLNALLAHYGVLGKLASFAKLRKAALALARSKS